MMVLWAVVVVVAVVAVALLYWGSRKPRGFPPGPPRLPVLGFVPFLEPQHPYKHMWRLSSTYGPVIGVYFGLQPTVLVNGWDAVRESLLNDDLNGRPEVMFNNLIYGSQQGVMFAEGDMWKEQRRFTLHQFRNLGFGKRSHETIVHEEVADLLQEVKSVRGSITLQGMLGVSSINILWAVMGGTRFGRKDQRLWELVDMLNKLFRAGDVSGGVVEIFPFLRHIMPENSSFNILMKGFLRVLNFIQAAVKEHKATLQPDAPRDFMDIYLNEMKKEKNNPTTNFTDQQLTAVCSDIFSAGTETGSATTSFAILMMALHPDVMAKVQKELDEVVGRGRLPAMEDRSKLVYTEATLNETFRFRGAAPLTVPHRALRDTVLQGYRIPARTVVMNNLYSVHMDPHHWGDPHSFRPQRFINTDGTLRKEERLIPFGKGRRACLGESLARMTFFVLFTSLLQHFTFTLDPSLPVPDTEGKSGFTLGPPDFRVFAKPRF